MAPIGADRTTTQRAYARVNANALRTGRPGPDTVSILHRLELSELAQDQPDEAVRRLHEKALQTGERDLLYALSEMSFLAGDRIRHSVKPWDPRDARDYYLGSAVYAWLFLFGEAKGEKPSAFDRRFRAACDFYNAGLGLALQERRSTNASVVLQSGRRPLPVGDIEVQLRTGGLGESLGDFSEFLLADQFTVRGFSVRNRNAGLGAPLIAVLPTDPSLNLRRASPATVVLRVQGTLSSMAAGRAGGSLELYSPDKTNSITIGQSHVPLEMDLTAHRAYTLNQARIWSTGVALFLSPGERIRSQLILHQPYDPDKIPLVLVHGTFSSPVTWAEMANTLTSDVEIREHYQLWSFLYGSGNPLVYSLADLRQALTAEVNRLDPKGTNAALRDMVIIGHSQGGLLTKGTAIETGDRLWRLVSTNKLENLKVSDAQVAELHRLLFLEPLPFVRRVVFIATPHRGSYLSGSFVRRLAQLFVSLPSALTAQQTNVLNLTAGSLSGAFLGGRLPTSLDSMSPKNPVLKAMADVPVKPPIKSNSIIAVQGDEDYHKGKDGLVSYESAHVDYAESEFIVRNFHTCLDHPAVIEEVRRILHEHLQQFAKHPPPGG
jgi:pimeloyl-ACP methyl ester carboxylesterase